MKHGACNTKLMVAAAHAQQAHSARCVNINYTDTGLFGLSVTGHAEEVASNLQKHYFLL